MDYQINQGELINILSVATQIGIQKGLEASYKKSKYISQNQACKLLGRARLETLIKNGLLEPKYHGNGKTSTKLYDVSEVMKADASEKIVVRKVYESTKTITP
jgi:hypothetical protein